MQFGDHTKVIEKIMEQAREAFVVEPNQQQRQTELPFGMPTPIRSISSTLSATSSGRQSEEQATTTTKRRRSTVAMKLATLAMPKLTQITTPNPIQSATDATNSNQKRGYISFLPSLTDVVVAPARNIMNKAMGFNKAVQGLISTLSPGGSSSKKQPTEQQQQQTRTTMPMQSPTTLQEQHVQQHFMQMNQQSSMPPMQHMQRPPVQHFPQQQQQQQQHRPHPSNSNDPVELAARLLGANGRNTSDPLLLTEEEARALSAQLDTLSKEQLEALSRELAKNDHAKSQQQQQLKQHQQQQLPVTESPDYAVRLLKMLSKSSHNPEDVRLLDQLAKELSNPNKATGGPSATGGQPLIEIGQPDDLALLQALGLVPAQVAQAADQGATRYSLVEQAGSVGERNDTSTQQAPNAEQPVDIQQAASYDNFSHQNHNQQMRPDSIHKHHRQHKQQHYHQQQQHHNQFQQQNFEQPKLSYSGMQPIEMNHDLGTTKFVPVTLELHEQPNKYSPTTYHYPSTTTTTSRPTELVTQVFQEQFQEKTAPPVKQTFTEVIENNVTTPDGIETTIETRTKSAVSSGASYHIGAQLGLGMIPQAFGGSIPADSPLAQQQMLQINSDNSKEIPTLPNATLVSNTTSSSSLTNKTEKVELTSVSPGKTGVKGGANNLGRPLPPSQVVQSQQQLLQQQQQFGSLAPMQGQYISPGSVGSMSSLSFGGQPLQFGSNLPADQRLQLQQQQQQQAQGQGQGQTNGFSSTSSTSSSSNLLGGSGAFREQQSTSNSFSPPRSNMGSQVNLQGYNFASQPVDQFEEVVIRKKFKPFPKTVMVPQTQSFTVEEVMRGGEPQVQFGSISGQQSSDTSGGGFQFSKSSSGRTQQQQQQQQQQSSVDVDQSGTTSSTDASTSSGSQSDQRVQDEDFSTVASTFGENSFTSSLTSQDIRAGQQFEQQRDLQRIQPSTSGQSLTSLRSGGGGGAAGQQQATADLQQLMSFDQFGNPTSQAADTEQQAQQPGAQMPLIAGQGTVGEVTSVGLADALAGAGEQSDGNAFGLTGGLAAMSQLEREQTFGGGGSNGDALVFGNPPSSEQPQSGIVVGGGTGTGSGKTRKSSRKSGKSQRRSMTTTPMPNASSSTSSEQTTTTSTSTTSTSTTKAPAEELESSTAKRSVGHPGEQPSGSRVEAAFNNFMVELKRSRKASDNNPASVSSTTSTTSSTSTTTTTSTTQAPKQKRKSRSKKQKSQSSSAGRDETADESSVSKRRTPQPANSKRSKRPTDSDSDKNRSNRRSKATPKRLQNPDTLESRPTVHQADYALSEPVAPGERLSTSGRSTQASRTEHVDVYGTKSGFMPILSPNDPSYASSLGAPSGEQLQQVGPADPLNFGASHLSNRLSGVQNQLSTLADANDDNEQISSGGGLMLRTKSGPSWRSFVRKLSDQISVVHLGNYSERVSNHSSQTVQVKLVILPASPDNRLLDARNWHHLASNYPQLFAPSLADLQQASAISLGPASINLRNGGLIDQQLERARLAEFKRQYAPIAQLIEDKTFMALDEIVQRSSGQLFMLQRRATLDRTLVAVIPERPFIRSSLAPSGNHYERIVATARPTSTTAAAATKQATDPASASQLLSEQISAAARRANSFSSSDSMAATQRQPTPEKAATFSRAVKESIQDAIRQHYDTLKNQVRQSIRANEQSGIETGSGNGAWSTPAADALALAASDPIEASSSSTEYSVVSAPEPSQRQHHHLKQTLLEVEGAEPKALYGLELGPVASSPSAAKASEVRAAQQQKQRFISIGSHLIASPMKKIVDQAYVNHFYDHISDHQLAKSIGFPDSSAGDAALLDDLSEPQLPQTNQTSSARTTGDDKNQESAESITADPKTTIDDSLQLVPESACTRPGLFQHPFACNKFYECFWDKQLNKYTFHMFECPIKLAFDERVVGCAMPIESSLCVNY